MWNRPVRNAIPSRKRPRRRGTARLYRLFVVGSALAASNAAGVQAAAAPKHALNQGVPASAGAAQDSQVLQFNIPSGLLDVVLAAFQRVAGLKVRLTDPAIGTVQSPGVSGAVTPVRAMEALLSGTSVRATFSTDAVELAIRGVSEYVAVEGEAPRASSPKYTEPIRETPQTIVVIPQQVFLEQGATSLREVLRNTPGITMSIGEGGSGGTSSGDNVLVRGFSARNDIYIDGARDVGLVSRDAFNTESVEVVKGPSGATGGRGVTGGSINLVSKTAELKNAATVRFTGGSADYGRSTIDVNRKVSETMAVRLNGMWQSTWYPGRDVAKYKSWGVAPSLALGLGKPTMLTLNYSRLEENNSPDWGLPTLLPDVAIAKGITVNDLNFSNFYGIASRDYEKTTSDIGTVIVDHKFSPALSLRNLTRYGKNYRDAVLTPPRPVTSAAGQGSGDPGYNPAVAQIRRTDTKYQHRDDRIATNQTDLSLHDVKTGRLEHDADFGLEISRDHQPTYASTDLFSYGRPPVDDLFNPTPHATYAPALAKTGATTDAHATTVALYAFDTVNLNERWAVDLGGRWDRIAVDYATVSATNVAAQFGRTDSALSGRAGILYKPKSGASIYAAYSTSFISSFDGTLGLTLAATGVNSQALPPERTHNIEVGTKWELGKGLEFTAAVFDIAKTKAKTTDETGATVLAGDQDVKGIEFGLSGNLTSRWGAFGGLSLMDGTVKRSGIASEIGARLPYVPKTSLNLWSTYRLPMGITVGGGANYSDGNYFNQTGSFAFVGGGTVPNPKYAQNAAAIQALTRYWLFNAVAMYQVNNHLLLQVNGTNLGNERYADRAYDRHFLPGPTRQVIFRPVITW